MLAHELVRYMNSPSPKGRACIKASGLQLNSEKSQLFCTSNAELLVERLGIPLSTLPVQDLGLPLQSGYLSNTSCLPLIDKMRKKL
ncbi:hypothetical protein QJS10_CPA01g01539 [Acorus calamus]|uniref:Reverse transcriptase n=1 Tax=Acorus calamus TaxID=4465 RepID=A0AAV9FLB0_ACOCL|nr:hypothetical protein QJS10_CPA01g01539 [Acorus calamus]